jgi:hypothetical protein
VLEADKRRPLALRCHNPLAPAVTGGLDPGCYRAAPADAETMELSRCSERTVMTEPVETRGDERHEMLAVDTNNDGVADVLAIDTDGNGKADLFQLDSDGDGKIDVTMVDLDEDSIMDTTVDGDGGH